MLHSGGLPGLSPGAQVATAAAATRERTRGRRSRINRSARPDGRIEQAAAARRAQMNTLRRGKPVPGIRDQVDGLRIRQDVGGFTGGREACHAEFAAGPRRYRGNPRRR